MAARPTPFASFISPENVGPLLPDRTVAPGQTWTVEDKEKDPDSGISLTLRAVNTLFERRKIGGNDAAVIHSVLTVPFDVTLDHDALVADANPGEDTSDIPRDASLGMVGSIQMTLTQTVYTANGLLQSALGDGSLRGTMTIKGVPGTNRPLTVVFDLNYQITMTQISAGAAA